MEKEIEEILKETGALLKKGFLIKDQDILKYNMFEELRNSLEDIKYYIIKNKKGKEVINSIMETVEYNYPTLYIQKKEEEYYSLLPNEECNKYYHHKWSKNDKTIFIDGLYNIFLNQNQDIDNDILNHIINNSTFYKNIIHKKINKIVDNKCCDFTFDFITEENFDYKYIQNYCEFKIKLKNNLSLGDYKDKFVCNECGKICSYEKHTTYKQIKYYESGRPYISKTNIKVSNIIYKDNKSFCESCHHNLYKEDILLFEINELFHIHIKNGNTDELLVRWNLLLIYILENNILSNLDIEFNENELLIDKFKPYHNILDINSNGDLLNFLRELEKLGVPLETSMNIFLEKGEKNEKFKI